MSLGRHLARIALAAALLVAAAPAFAQRLGQGTGTEVPIWRVLAALLLCLSLAVAAAVLLRRRLGGGARPVAFGGSRRLQLVETLRLSHQLDLCVVSCDSGEFLIASTPHGATLIKPHLAAPEPAKEPE